MADVEFSRVRDYKDVSLSFAQNPVTLDVVLVTGADAVSRSIETLLFTMAGEVPFFPDFGSRVYKLLFEPIDGITSALLQSEIRDTLSAYEPRVKIESLVLTADADHNGYALTLTYSLINLSDPITLSLFLTRLR